ncbi:hypothetical protein [Tahibacter soli]|uniref:Ig-like domain-containing protein n=1 Tax=Tahibacter soli TaxID=2983605 RepID=A0A9X4BJC6_9GAMM|nr:hypothetical protein [Tahibacter soli]MDC8012029.1 hypothetical protein [Tahibacter soli]
MLNNKTASAAGALLGLALASNAAAQTSCTPTTAPTTEVEGNKTSAICLETVAGGNPRTFSYQFFGSSYSWQLEGFGSTTPPSSGSIGVTNGVSGTRQPYTLTTSGLPITGATPSSTRYVQFTFCYLDFLNITCDPTPQQIKFKVDPIVRLAPSATIGVDGDTFVTATLGEEGDNPTPNAEIEATCTVPTPVGGPTTVTVTPSSLFTNSNGSAGPFKITATNLRVYALSGDDPKSDCTFRTKAGTKSAKIGVRGQRIYSQIAVTPTSANPPRQRQLYTAGIFNHKSHRGGCADKYRMRSGGYIERVTPV